MQKLATWLVLVAYLVSGLAPAQALVLCVEADGSIVLEDAASRCAPCDPAEGNSSVSDAEQDCPCIDIPLPVASQEDQARPVSLDLSFVSVAGPPPSSLPIPVEGDACAVELAWRSPPRPPASLELIRTIVLRV